MTSEEVAVRRSPVPLIAWVSGALLILAVGLLTYYYFRPLPEGEAPAGEELPYIVDERPELIAWDDLVTLSDTPLERLEPGLRGRLDTLLTTPFINNEAYYDGLEPHRPIEPGLGPTLRVVSWNIERGFRFELIRDALAGGRGFLGHVDRGDDDLDFDDELMREIERDLEVLQAADVVVLQEADWGVKRTDYRAVVEELARAAGMNWAYGVEFIEVDPFSLGMEEFADVEDEEMRAAMRERNTVDRDRYAGLHGTAVLSRYPILDARLIPHQRQGYDWFAGELDGVHFLEDKKRDAAEEVFKTPIGREVRRGGRTMLLVDLEVPDVDEGLVTIAAVHFESRAEPEVRREQLLEALANVREIDNPVVLAGDMNTSGQDGTPTSWKRELYRRVGDVEFWGRTAAKQLAGIGIVFDAAVAGVGFLRKSNDPTVKDIPVLSPNDEAGFFEELEDFRFGGGHVFDFRGDEERSVNGNEGTLANSNHRDDKGFVVTYEVERTLGPAGKLKLDWIFVKAYATDPRDPQASYRFAPHRGRTLEPLNYAVTGRMSDHSPISVDLPLPVDGR